jgi:threonine/homoserine/homoserine lactone efflux protein
VLPLNFFLFTQIILFLFITPGSPRVLIVSYAIRYGIRKAVWTALGDISANILQMIVLVFGVGSLLFSYPQILSIIKWLGIIYLLYLAYELIQSQAKKISIQGLIIDKKIFSFFKDGFIVAGLSPKAWIFIGTIFPTFINFEKNYVIQFIILGITYITLDFITLMIYALIAGKIVVWLKANPKIINTVSSIALVIIALIAAFVKF